MRILLTGFEPFDGDDLNPSWEVARALHGAMPGGAEVVALRLPCEFGRSREQLCHALAQQSFDLLLSLGLAANRTEPTIERVAINVDDARIPDNAGAQPVDQAVVADGPAAYFASVPVKRMVAALHEGGLPASVSQTAGTFVCNHVFYAAAHWRATHQPALRVGFMHLPLLHAQAARHPGMTGMALDTQVQAVTLALQAAMAHHEDLRLAGGAIA